MYDKNGEHWKLKSEIHLIKQHIDKYIKEFNQNNLLTLTIENQKIISDIIWIES